MAAGLEILRVAIGAYLHGLRSIWSPDDGPAAATPGLAEVDRLLAAAGVPGSAEDAQRALVDALVDAGRRHSTDPFGRLVGALELTAGEELLVAAAWWSEADPQFATVLGCVHDDGARRYASAAVLRLVLAPFGIDVAPALDDRGCLVRFGVLEAGAGAMGPLRLTATCREVLAGIAPAPLQAPPPPARLAPLAAALARHLRRTRGQVVLRGGEGSGRRRVAVAAATGAGLVAVEANRPPAELRLLARLGIGVPVAPAEAAELLAWGRQDGPLLLLAPPRHRSPATRAAYLVDVEAPDRVQRASYWRQALESAGASVDAALLADALAQRFGFTEGDIDAVVARATLDARWQEVALDQDCLWDAARRQPEHALERLAALVVPAFTLDDLVLPEEALAQLSELLAHVTLQHVVLDRWGFRRRLPRGQGVAALFAGPSGTGKTMAAEALAAALHQDLYRVDLSSVVSKYIGETEKNLSSAFDEAERAGAVLLFDEADSLFGKRTEVRDAHDRYANLEVNYLLQRVELFTGLVILATNRRSALDEAFLRRLRFVIRFDMPDAELRRRLWQRSFPPETATAGLDWAALASGELAGGNIQQAALHSAFLAARNGGVVTTEHVAAALAREYDKLGRSWPGLPSGARCGNGRP